MPPLRVLTVCTGNVCRSPAAAVMLRQAVREAGLGERIEVGSAGTSWEAEGMPMDDRTLKALIRAGYTEPFEHTARSIHVTELVRWDVALPMTAEHAERLRRMAEHVPEGTRAPEIVMWRQFDPDSDVGADESELSVPDPWYEGRKAFDRTVASMQRAIPSLLVHLRGILERRETAGGRPVDAAAD